ncbi:MAG: aldehyde dehydrogenase family protein [Myxococcales bacterium]|nr:aldehyde dehydrogenase family protein [Myxococcales bacterium]
MSSASAVNSQSSSPGAQVVSELRTAFKSGKTRSLKWRLAQLDAMKRMLIDNQEHIIDAIAADLGKPRFEAFTTEVGFLLSEIEHTQKNLAKWMKPVRVKSAVVLQPASSKIYSDPLGVTLVIGAWNYPLQLSLGPAIGAIAAGNCVVVKPSEVSHYTSALIHGLLPQYLDSDCVRVVEGGIPETTDLLEQKWDYIFYTGNGTVGRIIMTAAAKNLTPVALELGGKSPTIVDESADLDVTARRIIWGKFTNAGQTCVAPDYVLVHERVHDELVAAFGKAITEFYGTDTKSSADYGRIINERHCKRLIGLLDGGNLAHGGEHDLSEKFIAPTVMTGVDGDSPIMAEEIFGPILPVLKVSSIHQAIDFVNERAKPLALYVFAGNKTRAQQVIHNTTSGGGSINHVWMHLAVPGLPFGGVGESGMGAYHGHHSFNLFSHKKSILDKPTFVDPNLVYPPYGDFKQKLIKRLL